MSDPRRHWKELEGLLVEVLKELGPVLTGDETEDVTEYIANREYGLAYEWLAELIAEHDAPLREGAKAGMARAAALMGL